MAGMPDTIGPYEILCELGHGGLATVYLARGRVFDKTQLVALKVLNPPAMRDREKVERFKREARALAELRHRNIIKILGADEDEENIFIVMEYIPGGTLRQRLETGPLPRDLAIHIIKGIGAALIAAHTHQDQIIHRDLKPENILLDMKGKRLRPVLTDFGLLKQLLADDVSSLTGTGDVVGTPPYMAPEQSEDGVLTPLTDLYVLAIIFFEMLAGWLPLKRIPMYQTLPTLSSVAPNVGPFFDQVLTRSTAKEPSDRFRSVVDFIQALDTANDQAQYAAIEYMAKNGQIDRAIEELKEKFIIPGKNYRNSLSLLDALLYAKEHNGDMPPGWDTGLEKEQGYKKLKKQHEINKYIIPISMAVAMIAGGIISPQIQDLPGLPIIMSIGLVFSIVYFAYYIWNHYLS
jgi:serine/threonine protein kinase